jgi:hypothetical protein
MNALMWAALGFSIWICIAMFVLALGKAAARGDDAMDAWGGGELIDDLTDEQ